MSQKLVSIVAPAFNEGHNVVLLVQQLAATFSTLPYSYEVILVNDGSDAESTAIIDQVCAANPAVGALHLSRNFGHQAALTAGLAEAKGEAIITMDSDLQHPVALIPKLLELWERGFEIVYTIRKDSPASSTLFKRATSRLFYQLLDLLSPMPVIHNAPDFRLLSRAAADSLAQFPERRRYLRGLIPLLGFSQTSLEFEAQPRQSGQPKFGTYMMVNLGLDAILSLSVLPLKFSLFIGSLISLVSFGYMAFIFVSYLLFHTAIRGWSSLMATTIFLSGLIINLLGVLGLYVGRIYEEVKARPLFLVARKSGQCKTKPEEAGQ